MLEQNSREQLNDIMFDYYITNAEMINKMQDIAQRLRNRIKPSRIAKIFNQAISIEMVNDYEMYYLSKLFYDITKEVRINPAKYFTDVEIEDYESEEEIRDNTDQSKQVILKNVITTIDNEMWTCAKVTAQELKMFMDNNLIIYNPRTQRPMEKRVVNGEVKERIKLNKQSVKEIKTAMLEGKYFPTALVFNILKNGEERFLYNSEKQEMIIQSEINLLDGHHRYTSLMDAIRENPELCQNMVVSLVRLTEKQARELIRQENKRNLFEVEVESYYNASNIYTIIVDELSSEGTESENFMKNRIAIDYSSLELQNKYVLHSTLVKAIQDNFDISEKDIVKRRKVKEFIMKYLKEVIGILYLDFENIKQSQKENFSTYNNMFYGYIALASKLYGVDNWQDKLYDIIADINFDKKSEVWKAKGIELKDIPGKQLNNLYGYFKSLYVVEEENEGVS